MALLACPVGDSNLSFAKTASDSPGEDPWATGGLSTPDDRRADGPPQGSRHASAIGSGTERCDCPRGRMTEHVGSGARAAQCRVMLRGGRRDDVDCRLQESARPCPSPAARSSARRAHPSRARGESVRGDSRRSVRPEKADVFSGRQSHRGNSQTPRSLDGRAAGNQSPEAHRRHHRTVGSE
jgi:hypothetical protein